MPILYKMWWAHKNHTCTSILRPGKSLKMSANIIYENENVRTLISKNVHTFLRVWTFILYKVTCFKEIKDIFKYRQHLKRT